MDKNIKEIGGLSRKAKINIFISVFLLFIIIAVFSSIRQITNIIQNREKILELEEKLNYYRQENIKLLAEEKSLYEKEAIESEARKQFNMTKGSETNFFIELIEPDSKGIEQAEAMQSSKDMETFTMDYSGNVYQEADLWQNIRILYENEIRD
ncbi:MAG: cell division protein FtsL [Actinobacteria bacterium]|nr:cell division protein FtsL [Actinomycetota bacterium]